MDTLPYNKKLVGERITFSGEHRVYFYGKDKVIKFPGGPIFYFDRLDALNKIKNDYKQISKYLREFLIASKIYFYSLKGKQTYCIIQDYIHAKPLRLRDLRNKKIHLQFQRIVCLNKKMKKETGYTMEFFGIFSLFFYFLVNRMENIVVMDNDKLAITDFGLISDDYRITKSYVLTKVIKWAEKRQRRLLEKYENS